MKKNLDAEIQVSPEDKLLTGKLYINPKTPISKIELNFPIKENIKLSYSIPYNSFNLRRRRTGYSN